MFRSLLVVMAILSLAPFVVFATHDIEKRKDHAKDLQGKWQVVMLVDESGKPAPQSEIKDMTFEFSANVLTIRTGRESGTLSATFKTDTSKMPNWFDMEVAKFGVTLGIYKIEGDRLEICQGPDFKSEKDSRPSEFRASKKSVLFTLKRTK